MPNDMIALPRQKLIFIATNNQRGDEPLWPKPHGCAGYGLWKLIYEAVGWDRDEYLMRTDRRHIVESPIWNADDAMANIEKIKHDIDGSRAIVIGAVAARLFDVSVICEWENTISAIPNPAFINPFYADQSKRAFVVDFLREALEQ